jgi:hypothetical protein
MVSGVDFLQNSGVYEAVPHDVPYLFCVFIFLCENKISLKL